MNFMWMGDVRPAWVDALLAGTIGLIGQAIVVWLFSTDSGSLEAVPGLLLPAAVGMNAVEAARMSAMAAGARRVTMTSSGMGIDAQAIFGDPIVGETAPPANEGLRPIG